MLKRKLIHAPEEAEQEGIEFVQKPRAYPVEVFSDGTFYDAIRDGVHGEWTGDVDMEEWEEY